MPTFNHEGFRAYFQDYIDTVGPAALMPLVSGYITDSRYADPLQRALVDVRSLTHDDIDIILGIPELQAVAAAYEATDPALDPGPVCTECRSFTLLYQGGCITAAACHAMGNTVNGSSSVGRQCLCLDRPDQDIRDAAAGLGLAADTTCATAGICETPLQQTYGYCAASCGQC